MKPETLPALLDLNMTCEGGEPNYMYADVYNYVTTGIGLLIDPIAVAHRLVWLRSDGTRCDPAEVVFAWNTVKSRKDLCKAGGGAYKKLTSIRATKESLDAMYAVKVAEFEKAMKRWFDKWESWPWQAQTACLAMCWAMGAGFPMKYPHFVSACQVEDWAAAATESHMNDSTNPGLTLRNVRVRQLFLDIA